MSRHAKATRSHPLGAPVRGAGVIVEREHDAYRAHEKPPEPTACPDCGASFRGGRWSWAAPPEDAQRQRCPACRRIHDKLPAGTLAIEGEFFRAHRDELMALLHHHAERERAEHPLQRIMSIDETADGVLVGTTDGHLARGLGEALHRAYQGDFGFRQNEAEPLLRAHWRR